MTAGIPSETEPRKHRIWLLPRTRLGWWGVGLAVGSILLDPVWSILPLGAALGYLVGIAGGIAALVAIVRHRERAVAVFLAVLPMIPIVVFVLAELLGGHE